MERVRRSSLRIVCVGGGPAGLYFAILMKKADPAHEITVVERNRPDDTFGFGVVFSDATLETFAEADRETFEEITRAFAHWDDIDIHYGSEVLTSTGHGFCGLSRQVLLDPGSCRSAGILSRDDVRYVVLYRFGQGADLPAFATDPGRYRRVFQNPSVVIYAAAHQPCPAG